MLRSARIAGRARCRRRSARSRRRGLDLLEGALTRRLVGTPAQEPGAMAEPAAADMIVANFDDQFWAHWLPFCGALGAPPAGASRRVAGEAGRHDQPLARPKEILLPERSVTLSRQIFFPGVACIH